MSTGARGTEQNIQSTTVMVEDAGVKDVTFLGDTNIPSSLIEAYTSHGVEDVIKVLQKPSLLYQGVLAASDSGRLQSFYPLAALAAITKNARRLSGAQYIRADVVIELKINAVRFQAGRYILAYLPYGGAGYSAATTPSLCWEKMHFANLVTITQLPHVEIDLATETSVKLRIPYQSVWEWYSLTSDTYDEIGVVALFPYVALIPGSSDSTCQYTIYGYFENVHISGNIIAQSGRIDREIVKASGGPISSIAEKVARSATILGSVPMLSPITSTVSWIAGLVGSVAKVWGFSKPHNVADAQFYYRQAVPDLANSDGAFCGHMFGMSKTNEVAVASGVSRTKVDEMSVDFVKKIPAHCSITSWPSSATAGTLLLTLIQMPTANDVSYGHGITVAPVSLLGKLFNVWKGSLVYRFKFVKTEFHSGRLVIAHLPVDASVSSAPSLTLAQTDNLFREIIDLRDTNEFDFRVPYVNASAWAEAIDTPGYIYVFVLNELVAPSVVSNAVPMIVEILGGDDLEFGVPISTFNSYDPYVPYVSQSGTITGVIPAPSDVHLNVSVEKFTTGELCRSLRQFLKRFAIHNIDTAGTNYSWAIAAATWAPAQQPTSLSTNVVRVTGGASDFFTLFSSIYAISSGSVRIIARTQSGSHASQSATLGPIVNGVVTPVSYSGSYNSFSTLDSTRPWVVVDGDIEGNSAFEVPQYTKTYGRSSVAFMVGGNTYINPATTTVQGGPNMTLQLSNITGVASSSIAFLRAGGDDASFSTWAGVPCIINTANS